MNPTNRRIIQHFNHAYRSERLREQSVQKSLSQTQTV